MHLGCGIKVAGCHCSLTEVLSPMSGWKWILVLRVDFMYRYQEKGDDSVTG